MQQNKITFSIKLHNCQKVNRFQILWKFVIATTLQCNLLSVMDGICYSYTSNTKLSTAQCKCLKRRHICNKKCYCFSHTS